MVVFFVCTGNICRSPLAEALARHHARREGLGERLHFESFGTHDYHVGAGADPRTVATAREFGIDLSGHRARRLNSQACRSADLLFAMDSGHERHLRRMAPDRADRHVHLYLPWLALAEGCDVPDPYYGDEAGFLAVHELLDRASQRLIQCLRERLAEGDG